MNNLPDCVPYEQMRKELDGDLLKCVNCGVYTSGMFVCKDCMRETVEEDNYD